MNYSSLILILLAPALSLHGKGGSSPLPAAEVDSIFDQYASELTMLELSLGKVTDEEERARINERIATLRQKLGGRRSPDDAQAETARQIRKLEAELEAADPKLRALIEAKIRMLRGETEPPAPASIPTPVAVPSVLNPFQWAQFQNLVTPPSDATDFRVLTNNPNLSDPSNERALAALQEAVPYDPTIAALAGAAAFRRGEFSRADTFLGTAIEAGSQDSDVFYLRGAANLNLGRTREASADLQKALALDPRNKPAADLLMLAEKRVSPGGFKLRSATNEFERNAPGFRLLGAPERASAAPAGHGATVAAEILMRNAQEQARVGDRARAMTTLQKAVLADPANPAARLMLTEALLKNGRFKEAEEQASHLLKTIPEHAGALNLRATARNRLGDFKGALQDAEAAVRILPQSALAHWARSFALAGLGRRAEALASVQQAAALDPRFSSIFTTLRDLPADVDPLVAFAEKAAAPEHKGAGEAVGGLDPVRTALAAAGVVLTAFGLAFLTWRRRRSEPASAPRPLTAPPSSETIGPGALLGGNYRVEAELGRGSMGVVFKAEDLTLKRPVAIKMLRQYSRGRPEAAAQLLKEAQLVAGLKHPNIVQIHTAFAQGEDLLLVFEFVAGRPLSEVLSDFHHLPLGDAQAVVRQTAAALDHAHAARVIHRDLKPANIMVVGDGKVLVMDFGLAHQARQSSSRETNAASWGSPAYMAPEQEMGTVSAASDIYALGACFYEILTGYTPFTGSDALEQKQSMKFTPPTQRVPSLPAATDALMRRALHAKPQERFQTAGELALAVDSLMLTK